MHAASRHGTTSLTSLPKDDEVSCEVRPPRSPIQSSDLTWPSLTSVTWRRLFKPLGHSPCYGSPGIQLKKQRVSVSEKFSFQQVSLQEILSQLKSLDPTKVSPFGSTTVKILTEHSDLFAPLVQLFINDSIDTSKFPKELKKGDIRSLFKNGDAFAKRITGL